MWLLEKQRHENGKSADRHKQRVKLIKCRRREGLRTAQCAVRDVSLGRSRTDRLRALLLAARIYKKKGCNRLGAVLSQCTTQFRFCFLTISKRRQRRRRGRRRKNSDNGEMVQGWKGGGQIFGNSRNCTNQTHKEEDCRHRLLHSRARPLPLNFS